MNIVFLCRKSIKAKYIANLLAQEGLVCVIVLEKGTKAKRRKLQRIFKKAKWWEYPLKILDIIATTVYSQFSSRYLSTHLLEPLQITDYPSNVPLQVVDDANDENCLRLLKSYEPDIIIVLGTSILKQDVISIPNKFILNIHGGIVPHYRNVHSDFWAFYNKDYERIGTSIIYLDEGIDSGNIAMQAAIEINPKDSLLAIKKKNSELGGYLIIKAIRQAMNGTLPIIKQKESNIGFYPTPGFLELFLLMFKLRPDQ